MIDDIVRFKPDISCLPTKSGGNIHLKRVTTPPGIFPVECLEVVDGVLNVHKHLRRNNIKIYCKPFKNCQAR
jgi:hypothetical protein